MGTRLGEAKLRLLFVIDLLFVAEFVCSYTYNLARLLEGVGAFPRS